MLLSDSAAGYKIQALQYFSEYSKYIFRSSISALKYISGFTSLFTPAEGCRTRVENGLQSYVFKTTLV